MTTTAAGDATATQAPSTSLWRNRDYGLLVLGNTLSGLGTKMSGIAFPLLTFWLTGSPLMVGVVGAAEVLGAVLLGLPAGALVDRWHRKRTMVGSALGAAAIYATVTVAYALGCLTVIHLAVAGVVVGACAALYAPADTAALREVVPSPQLGSAMAVNQGRMAAAGLIGPPLGGGLFGVWGALPVLVDVLSYVVAALCAGAVRARLGAPAQPAGPREPMRTSIRAGLGFIWRHEALRPIFATSSALNFGANGLLLTLIIALQQRAVPPSVIGLLETVLAAGMLLGAMASGAILRRVPAGTLLVAAGWLLAAAFVVVSLTTSTWLVLVALGLGAVLLSPVNAGLMSYLMLITPNSLQGRVNGAATTVAMGVTPFAPLVGGLLLEFAGQRAALLAFTAVFAAAAVVPTVSRPIRRIPVLSQVAPVEDPVDAAGPVNAVKRRAGAWSRDGQREDTGADGRHGAQRSFDRHPSQGDPYAEPPTAVSPQERRE